METKNRAKRRRVTDYLHHISFIKTCNSLVTLCLMSLQLNTNSSHFIFLHTWSFVFYPVFAFHCPEGQEWLINWLTEERIDARLREAETKTKNDYFHYESICWLLSRARDRLCLWNMKTSAQSPQFEIFGMKNYLNCLKLIFCVFMYWSTRYFICSVNTENVTSFFEQMEDWRRKREAGNINIFKLKPKNVFILSCSHVASYTFMILMFIVL